MQFKLTDCAFEMFLSSGCTKFFVFADRVLRNKFANQVNFVINLSSYPLI